MALIIDIVSWALILAGSFFVLAGAIGMVRMPDLFTRMHAASVIDTAGIGLIFLGLMLQAGPSLVTLRLIMLLALFFFFGPVVTHALAQAALHEKVMPFLSNSRVAPQAAAAALASAAAPTTGTSKKDEGASKAKAKPKAKSKAKPKAKPKRRPS